MSAPDPDLPEPEESEPDLPETRWSGSRWSSAHRDGPVRDLTELLESIGERDGRLIHLERTAACPARTAEWPTWADPDLVAAYGSLGVERPWTHQVEAAQALHAGHHTVISTGTGSGKSMAAWLPVLSDVLASGASGASGLAGYRRRPTAVYLSPTKALAADQQAALERVVSELEHVQRAAGVPTAQLRSVRVGTCDGDTPMVQRDWVRAHGDVVLTNPDYLHFSLLPGHERWTRFLRSLRYVIIDECHAYRGVLGAHVALVVRRLLRLARRLQGEGPGPVVLCASATAAEPALTAARLIGVDPGNVVTVDRSGAPSGQRTLALWQPALRDPWDAWAKELEVLQAQETSQAPEPTDPVPEPAQDPGSAQGPGLAAGSSVLPYQASPDHAGLAEPREPDEDVSQRRSAVAEASELLVDLLSVGARALVFVRSRRSAEIVAERTRDSLSLSMPQLMDSVRAYRGGYLPEERRQLERDLRRGRLRALATTNALELGIDVTGLDAVIIAGWPGTRISLGQQAGRAGRAGSNGVAVLIASDDPLDAYLVHHPEAVFASPEATVFDPSNPYVLAPHLCAAASESPLRQEDLELFGLEDDSFLADLEARGALRRRPTGWFWNTSLPGRAQDLTSLRGDGPPDVPVVDRASGTVIGTVSGAAADRTVHPEAVYVHQGRCYVVDELVDDTAMVTYAPTLGYRTRAMSTEAVHIIAERDRAEWAGGVTWSFGSVEVVSRVTGYARLARPGMEIVSLHPLDMPERVLPTAAVWWTVPAALAAEASVSAADLAGALHAAEHASIGMLPLLATCDRWDIGGLSIDLHPDTGAPTVFVHDGQAGGAGFAERGWRAGRQWLAATLAAIESCPCAHGCPSCVQSPKCGNNNEPLDKGGAIILLRLLLAAAPKQPA